MSERPPADLPLIDQARWPRPGGHHLHLAQYGHPQGRPVLVLHGGPGSGCSRLLRRGFDATDWRVICLDQRGAGASQPAGATAHNTTADLLADLRALRRHLGLPRWWVVGGSWGATLALAHAADEPEAVAGLLLRASFLARPDDIAGFFDRRAAPAQAQAGGAARAAWDALAALLKAPPGQPLLPAIARTLLTQDAPKGLDIAPPPPTADQRALAAAWWRWEQALSGNATTGVQPSDAELDAQVARYRVQAHYLRHHCWLGQHGDGTGGPSSALPTLTDLARRIAGQRHPPPTLLLHGTEDRICPPAGARLLHQQMPHSRLVWAPGAGHSPAHPVMSGGIKLALASLAARGDFSAVPDPLPASASRT